MKLRIAIVLAALVSISLHAQSAPCNANFSPDLVKPGAWESVFEVFKNAVISKNQVQRLSNLRNAIIQVRKDKSTLADTLEAVARENSLPDWLNTKLKDIPTVENDIVALFWQIHEEFNRGGLFAGDESYRNLRELVDAKTKQLRTICVMSSAQLPLSASDREKVSQLVHDLRAEIGYLGRLDDAIGKLIDKANNQKNKKSA